MALNVDFASAVGNVGRAVEDLPDNLILFSGLPFVLWASKTVFADMGWATLDASQASTVASILNGAFGMTMLYYFTKVPNDLGREVHILEYLPSAVIGTGVGVAAVVALLPGGPLMRQIKRALTGVTTNL